MDKKMVTPTSDRSAHDRLTLPVTRRQFLSRLGRGAVGAVAVGSLASLINVSCQGRFGAVSSQGPLKIGLLAPVTGPVAPEGIALTRGFDMAVDAINASGGVLGQEILVEREDDQANPATATTAARKLLDQDGVHVLFGTITGDTSTAVANVADQAEAPFFQVILGGLTVCSQYVYKIGETPYQLLSPLLPFMVDKFGTRVALVGSDYEFPHRYNETAKQILETTDADVVAEEYAPLGNAEWSQVISKLQSAEPDVILSSIVGGDAIAFLQQSQSFGLFDTAEVTGVSVNQEFYPAVSDIDNGRHLSLRYSDQLDNEANREFVEEYRSRYDDPAPIAGVTANAFVGVHMLAEAVEQVGSTDGTAIADAMLDVRMPSLFGPTEVAFDPDNRYLNTHIYLSQIQPEGKYTIVEDTGVIEDPTQC